MFGVVTPVGLVVWPRGTRSMVHTNTSQAAVRRRRTVFFQTHATDTVSSHWHMVDGFAARSVS
jgi:hypothetical protein